MNGITPTTTPVPVPPVSPTTGLFVTAETVLADIHAVAPEVETFLPFIPGVGAQALLIAKLADGLDVLVANALAAIASANGSNPLAAMTEFVNHISVNGPNSPTLSGPASPVTTSGESGGQ